MKVITFIERYEMVSAIHAMVVVILFVWNRNWPVVVSTNGFETSFVQFPASGKNQPMARGYGSIPNMFSITREAKRKKDCKHTICEALLKQLWRLVGVLFCQNLKYYYYTLYSG